MIDKKIPTSTVPIVSFFDASILAYKQGIIQSDNHAIAEEQDVNPLRDVSLESFTDAVSFIDKTDVEIARMTDIMNAKLLATPDSTEAIDEYTASLEGIIDNLKENIGSFQDKAYRVRQKVVELDKRINQYTPPKEPYVSAYAKDVHVTNSLDSKVLLQSAKRQVALSLFIKDKYKNILGSHLNKVLEYVIKHFDKTYTERKLSTKSLITNIEKIAEDVKDEITISLTDMIIGVADQRQLIGGYLLERTPDWKNALLNIIPSFTLTKGRVLNVSKLLHFDHTKYTGDGSVNPYSKQDLKTLLLYADQIAQNSGVTEKTLTFTKEEFSDLLKNSWREGPSSLSGEQKQDFLHKLDDYLAESMKKGAIDKQIAAVAVFPLRVVSRNVKAALAITKFVEEAITKGQEKNP